MGVITSSFPKKNIKASVANYNKENFTFVLSFTDLTQSTESKKIVIPK